jgi:hypothetical protein
MNDEAIPSADAAAATARPGLEGEPEAWAAVLAAWDDEAAHRAYLARFADLDGLALAGGRYRAVLAERPEDALAARFRDEVVRRATVQGLASLPRAAPPQAHRLRRGLLVVAVLVFGGLAAWSALRLATLLAGGAP